MNNGFLLFCLVFNASFSLTSKWGAIFSWIFFPAFILVFKVLKNPLFSLVRLNYFFVLFLFLSTATYFSYRVIEFNDRFGINLFLSLTGAFLILVYGRLLVDLKKFLGALDLVLIFNCSVFFIQFLMFYVFGIKLDYNELTGGAGSRNDWNDLFRASGIYDEPAVFCMHVAALVGMRLIVCDRLNLVCFFSLLAMLCSFSFVGVLQATLLFFFSRARWRGEKLLFIGVVFVFFVFFYENFITRLNLFMVGGDGSNNTKIMVLEEFFERSDIRNYGYGLAGYAENYPLYYQGIYDLTFFGSLFTTYGLYVGLILNIAFFVFLFNSRMGLRKTLIALVVLLKVSVPTFMIYWLFLFFLIEKFALSYSARDKNNFKRF